MLLTCDSNFVLIHDVFVDISFLDTIPSTKFDIGKQKVVDDVNTIKINPSAIQLNKIEYRTKFFELHGGNIFKVSADLLISWASS